MKYNFLKQSYPYETKSILQVSLNRPELHNAFNDELIEELLQLGSELSKDKNLRVIILTGEGRSFCAGADLNWMKKAKNYTYEENKADALKLGQLFHLWNTLPQAVIGRINGAAIGGGTGLVAICDIALTIERAKFAFSEVNLGIIPAVISPFVIQKIGLRYAREFFITGQRIPAVRALEIGLVNYVEPDIEAVDQKITQLIQEILKSGPQAVTEAKKLVNILPFLDEEKILPYTADVIALLRTQKEGQEGMAAFLEKRAPSWVQTLEKKT